MFKYCAMLIKNFLRPFKYLARKKYVAFRISLLMRNKLDSSDSELDFINLKKSINLYLNSLHCDNVCYMYKYSSNSTKPTLYASIYACMIHELFDNLQDLSDEEKWLWCQYLDSFQNERDGLFYDSVTNNDIYADSDWWGARHLTLHIILAYSALGFEPKYRFYFLDDYIGYGKINSWLNGYVWGSNEIGKSDIDNKIMNIGCLLQYERDRTGCEDLKRVVLELKLFLRSKINSTTGIWGGSDLSDPADRSRMVQFAYHLLPIFFYDKEYDFNMKSIADIVLKTQNPFGGYGVDPNSSACEDIDSIDLLIAASRNCTPDYKVKIADSIKKGYSWILENQVSDGGFVFRLFEPFKYGHGETSSEQNIGALFPTWFRLLSIINARNFLHSNKMNYSRRPGYYFMGSDPC